MYNLPKRWYKEDKLSEVWDYWAKKCKYFTLASDEHFEEHSKPILFCNILVG